MAAHANHFMLLTILAMMTILLIFSLKYFSSARQAALRLASEGSYRELAEQTARAHSDGAATRAAIRTDLSDIRTRLAAVEKLLQDVG